MFPAYTEHYWYVPRRVNTLAYFDKETRTASVAGRRREPGQGRPPPAEQKETSKVPEARRANITPNGRPRGELGRLRLKTWSKPDFSIAAT